MNVKNIGKHEVVDRLSIIIANLDDYVLSHPFVEEGDRETFDKIKKVTYDLLKIYNELNILGENNE